MSTSPALEHYIDVQQEKLIQLYRDAYEDVVNKLRRAKLYGMSQEHLAGVLADIDQILTRLDADAQQWIEDTFPDVYADSSRQTVIDLARRYHLEGISASFGQVHQDAVKRLMADTFADVAASTDQVRKSLKEAIRDAARGIFRLGELTGETRQEMTRRLVGQLAAKGFTAEYDAKGKYIRLSEYEGRLSYEKYADLLLENHWVGFVDAAGRRWDLENYAEMLTRTKVREAVSRGTEDRLGSNGLDLVQIVGPTEIVDWCGNYRGKVFSISGQDPDFPPLSSCPNGGTPFHPRCKDIEAPWVKKFHTAEEIEAARMPKDSPWLGKNKENGRTDQSALMKMFRGSGKSALEDRMETIRPDKTVSARSIIPVHEAREQQKLETLVKSMEENGWEGRPVLVYDSANGYQAVTGSHRIIAAKKAGIDVPIVEIEIPVLTDEESVASQHWAEFFDASDDDERLAALEKLFDDKEISEDVIKLMRIEVKLNS